MTHYGPGLSYYSPEFPDAPVIEVYDGVARTLRLRRARKWRKALDRAIGLWLPAVTLAVKEVAPLKFVGLGEPDWPATSSEVASFSVPGHTTLVRSTYTPDAPKYWPFAWSHAYASFFNVPRILKQPYAPTNQLDRVICHEIGHCLGLAHGGNGIMSGGVVPNEHDLTSVKEYYR